MKLETFDFQTHAVRVVTRDGEPWFFAADVCRVLDIANSRDAVGGLDEDEKGVVIADTLGGQQKTQIISESGFYTMVLRSRKPEAKPFRKWVTSEVLPAIRKTGRYAVDAPTAPVNPVYMETPKPLAEPGRVSLVQFVQLRCRDWAVDKQIEFGRLALRYCRALGVALPYEVDTTGSAVRMYPAAVLLELHGRFVESSLLGSPDAIEFERMLEHVCKRCGGPRLLRFDELANMALQDGFFKDRLQGSLRSRHSAFGKLLERFNGQAFPCGLQLIVRANRRASYEIRQTGRAAPASQELALTA